MGLINKMNNFFKGENKQVERVVDHINQDAAKVDMQKLLTRIEDTDSRKYLSKISDDRLCELSDLEDKQYKEFAVDVTVDGIVIKNQDKRKSLHEHMQIIENTSQAKTPQEKGTIATQQHYEKGDDRILQF